MSVPMTTYVSNLIRLTEFGKRGEKTKSVHFTEEMNDVSEKIPAPTPITASLNESKRKAKRKGESGT